VDLDVAWQEWQTAEAAKLQVFHVNFLDRQLEVAGKEEAGLRENLAVVRRALNLGFVTIIDLAAAEAALNKIHATLLTLEQQREQERLNLNQLLGFPPQVILQLQLPTGPSWPNTLPSVQEFSDQIEERRLDLLALKNGYQSQEERLRAAILQQFPKITIGFSRARDTSNIVTTGFGIAIDLPLFDRNQGAIASESATRAKLFDEYVARVFEARSEVARILANMDSLQRERDVAEKSIPTMQNVVESYRAALLQGNADVLTYYNSRAELTAKQLELVDLKHQLDDLRVGLEVAAGRYLGPAGEKGAIP
jgi:outer membrane protein TolC